MQSSLSPPKKKKNKKLCLIWPPCARVQQVGACLNSLGAAWGAGFARREKKNKPRLHHSVPSLCLQAAPPSLLISIYTSICACR